MIFPIVETLSPEPDPLVVEVCTNLKLGTALDLAGGAGRHSIWLAQRGWLVLLTDSSEGLLRIAATRSGEAGVALRFRQEPVSQTLREASTGGPERNARFNLILAMWLDDREHFEQLPALLAPNGIVIVKDFTCNLIHAEDSNQSEYLVHGDLPIMPGLEMLVHREWNGVTELVKRCPPGGVIPFPSG